MNALESYLETLKIGAYASVGALIISIICLVLLAIIISDLAAVKKALGAGQPLPRRPADQAPPSRRR